MLQGDSICNHCVKRFFCPFDGNIIRKECDLYKSNAETIQYTINYLAEVASISDSIYDKMLAKSSDFDRQNICKYILDRIREYIDEYSDTDEDGNHCEKWCAMKEAEQIVFDAMELQKN